MTARSGCSTWLEGAASEPRRERQNGPRCDRLHAQDQAEGGDPRPGKSVPRDQPSPHSHDDKSERDQDHARHHTEIEPEAEVGDH